MFSFLCSVLWQSPLVLMSAISHFYLVKWNTTNLGLWMFNDAFNTILAISWRSGFFDGGNRNTRRQPPICRKWYSGRKWYTDCRILMRNHYTVWITFIYTYSRDMILITGILYKRSHHFVQYSIVGHCCKRLCLVSFSLHIDELLYFYLYFFLYTSLQLNCNGEAYENTSSICNENDTRHKRLQQGIYVSQITMAMFHLS
jgi:hypothetical protein